MKALTAGISYWETKREVKIKKWFTFSKCYNFVSLHTYYSSLTKQNSLPKFVKHKVVDKYKQWRKIVFDIDAEGVTEETYQGVINSLVSILQEVINLDVEKELIMCTSHGQNRFSAHPILLCFINKDSQDLEHLYNLVKERMPPELYKYIDLSLSHFNHNVRLLGSTKEGCTKVYNPTWRFKDQIITTQIPKYYPDLDDSPDRRFIN